LLAATFGFPYSYGVGILVEPMETPVRFPLNVVKCHAMHPADKSDRQAERKP